MGLSRGVSYWVSRWILGVETMAQMGFDAA